MQLLTFFCAQARLKKLERFYGIQRGGDRVSSLTIGQSGLTQEDLAKQLRMAEIE